MLSKEMLMRYLIVTTLFLLLATVTPLCAQSAPGDDPEVKSEYFIVGKNAGTQTEDFRFQLGDPLSIKVTGDLVANIKTEWGKSKSVTLYFDGDPIAALQSQPLEVEAGRELRLDFVLVRKAENDANRQAWDRFFKTKHDYLMTIQPSLALGNEPRWVVQSFKPLQFYVAAKTDIWLTLAACLAALLASFWYLVTKTRTLCDADSNYFSLGKSQMAFWGLLVVLSFVGVWRLTGTMERIPLQALILIGISFATGLSSVVVGNSKKTALQNKLNEKHDELNTLELEVQKLQGQTGVAPPASTEPLAAITAEIASKNKELATRREELDTLSKQLAPGQSQGFWRDICDDGNGMSFHRLQVVIWTLVLGAVFVQSVARVMSMPEFPDTLLTLMGISNATYLGFKLPEKP
jgi:hypothetical protein